jgi:hypothetical protein
VAWGQLAVRAIGILIDMWAVSSFVKVSVLQNLRVIWPPLLASGVMAAAVQALFSMGQEPSSVPTLAVAVVLGAIVYTLLIRLLDPRAVSSLTSLAMGMVRRRRAIGEA